MNGMKSLWLTVLWATLSLGAHAMPAQVIVIRHGEKPRDKNAKHLAEAGVERAARLVDYLKQNPELSKLGPPAALIAARQTKEGGGQRTSETLEPLARDLKLAIQTPYQSDRSDKLAALVRTSKRYDGKVVLICWTHERMPELIEALGIHPAPAKVPDDAYDLVYLIRYDGPQPSLQMLKQDMPSAPEGKEPKKEDKSEKSPHLGKRKFRW